jgi:hypothetical protein
MRASKDSEGKAEHVISAFRGDYALMQPKFAVERFELGRLDELRMSHHHAVQRPVELFPPECQEFDQDRKLRGKVVVLPDIGLQQARIIRQMIENTRGGEPISRELLYEIG